MIIAIGCCWSSIRKSHGPAYRGKTWLELFGRLGLLRVYIIRPAGLLRYAVHIHFNFITFYGKLTV